MDTPTPTCPGTGDTVHVGRTDGNGVTECGECRRWATTTPIEDDLVYRTVDWHPARRATITHPSGAVL